MIPQFKVFMAPDIDEYVLPVLNSGYITQGPMVEEFEFALKSVLGFEWGLTVNSGTSALMLALHLAGAKRGTTVVSTPMTCSATNEAIALMGADIIWADVDVYGNINPDDVKRRIKDNTVAVMAVDWGGLPCDYDKLREVIGDRKIPIIEDAAHAFGSNYYDYSVAVSGGDYVCFSFQAIKHLTTGDGGLVVCPDEASYERGKLLRWFGLDRTSDDAMRSRQDITEVGYKFHMNDIAAAIGLANMNWAIDNIKAARQNAKYYDEVLRDYRPEWPEESESSFWLYTIRVASPLYFEKWMAEKGVKVSQVHMRNDNYSCFSKYDGQGLNRLQKFYNTMCAIPVGWWLSDDDMQWIVSCINEYSRRQGKIMEW